MIEIFLKTIADFFYSQSLRWTKHQSEKLLGARSPLWSKTKRDLEKIKPKKCFIIVCKNKDIECHHLQPYHLFPELENDLNNLEWACRRHHYEIFHLFSWRSY